MRCSKCGFRKRGKEHEQGNHHYAGKYGLTDSKKITAYEDKLKGK